MTDLSAARLSLNQITLNSLGLGEAIELCLRQHVPAIAVWRDKYAEMGVAAAARLVRDSGLQVSSLCRGGFFAAPTGAARRTAIEDNLRAVDEAAELGAPVLVLVCGGIGGCAGGIDEARAMVRDGIAEIAPHARERGIRLGIEPLHPMFAADRSVICSLSEANDLADQFDETVGVVVDVFHVWHDARVYEEIARAGRRILGFHVSDWKVPLPDILLSRAMMGDGVIELRRLREAVEKAGYDGLIEVEIFNREIWAAPGMEMLATIKSRFVEFC